jgi:glycine oxidase
MPMTQAVWDTIIVGQGLAGTTLAWQLQTAGQRVLLIDENADVTSSKIAAGLITPITGLRLALSWSSEEFMTVAASFYRSIEARTGTSFFHDRTAIRLLKSDEEQRFWAKRCDQPSYIAHLVGPQPSPLVDPTFAESTRGGFAMVAAQLDVPAYLAASREALPHATMTLDWHRDITFSSDQITIPGHAARHLISCEGYAATRNPYFAWVPFKAAKGDILTVRFHSPLPPNTVHCGVWVAPTTDPNVFRVGSTYDLENLDQQPSPSARAEIEDKLRAFCHAPYTVLDHQAAIRPIIQASQPLIGLHPAHAQLGYFNGLGSKGSLHAPYFARCLSEFLVGGRPIADAFDVQKKFQVARAMEEI